MTITAHIIGTPKPQPRVKAFSRGGHAGVYTPKTADEWKSAIADQMCECANLAIDGAVRVTMCFYMQRPKSHFRTGKYAHILKDTAPKHHTSKPDGDNLAKGVMDALTDIQVWKDDAQVVYLGITKFWEESEPGMSLVITTENE
mgnify:FL=1